ncbi:MAG: hypothetical protein LQ351_002246 [Letrouitia transgressa]|nr:MAG: hypothetical protein LQ351_002246 [Letrouitia transgressa]
MAEANLSKPQDEEDNEEEEEIDETFYKSVKDAVLFVIEVSPSMLEKLPSTDPKRPERDSPASAALKCAYSLMQQRIISNPSDMMGVLLHGTEQSKFHEDDHNTQSSAYPHCYLFTDLDVPSAEDVKALKTLVEEEEDFKKLMVPSKDKLSMANVLFCANQIFTTRAANFSSRRLFIVTDNDDPHGNDRPLKSSATVRAKDLYDLGVYIELFPISKPGQEFDRRKFYDDIIYSSLPTDPAAPTPLVPPPTAISPADGLSLLNSLLSSINSRAAARRSLFSNLPFEIAPGLEISVKGYIIIKRQEPKRSCYVSLEGEKPQLAVGITTQMEEDTARTVEKVEIKKAFRFGGEQIVFTKDEISQLRNFGDPVIRIIGFKPIAMLPIWANLRPATFIYPSEDDYVGSTRVFSALWQKLLEDEKMGIVWYIARRNAAPVIAALYPGSEKLDEKGMQTMAPGLWLIPLPYADDVRQNPETQLIRAPEPLIDKMRIIVQQLQLPKAVYDPSKYPNPALQWHYLILQSLALETDLPTHPEDKTVPRHRQIHKRVGEYALDWGRELHAQHEAWVRDKPPLEAAATSLLVKRPRNADEEGDRKKARTDEDGEVVSDEKMRAAWRGGRLEKMKVAELKGWLKGKGEDGGGRKGELVDRVEGWFERK